MKFTKMHGAGNDYVYVDGFRESVSDPAATAIRVSDRHFGIGGDGLVLILPSGKADFRMRMFNLDGSEAEMCGNAIRCVAKYCHDRGLTDKTELDIETKAGIKRLSLQLKDGVVDRVRVWMGVPRFSDETDLPDIRLESFPTAVSALGADYPLHGVSMGNPHAIAFVDDVANFPVHAVGPVLEHHERFPKQINVEFIRRIDATNLEMRVWERGSGETLACGTGACASAAAAMRLGLVEKSCTVHLLGGDLLIEWLDDGIYMTGPATFVFDGEITL